MASATGSTKSEPGELASGAASAQPMSQPNWRWGFSLVPRILAVNVFAILMLAGSILYLDSFRERLIDQRRLGLETQARLVAVSLAEADTAPRTAALIAHFGATSGNRLRLYGTDGALLDDSWRSTGPTFELRDPATEPFRRDIARFLDRAVEAVGSFPALPDYVEPAVDRRAAWPEVGRAAATGTVADTLRFSAERIVVISTAAPLSSALRPAAVVQLTRDTRDITDLVRRERQTLFLTFLGVLTISLLISNFLANTIVRPLRRLAEAAQRVRLGRAREVRVPRFIQRRDEIGELARALSDMTATLRQRTDATEAFAADVAHELKNPLASLSSAVETLERVRDPVLQAQLLGVVHNDVARIDRLISDIADASRLDAELSRSRFDRVDLGVVTTELVAGYDRAGLPRGVELAFAAPEPGTAVVHGEAARLAQVLRNIIDNAVSFSPSAGVVVIVIESIGDRVQLRIDDDGPGIPPDNREDIFRRFYSERPAGEAFGRHSGLGLAISRTIVDAHGGSIEAINREVQGRIAGARFLVSVPAA